MANIITLKRDTPVDEYLQMSNGLTSSFINVFGFSGSRLAQTDQEKRLVVWVLEKNQSALGIGTVSFAICNMPWKDETFDSDKAFMLSVIDGIKKKLGWETLEYTPSERSLFDRADLFKNLLEKMTVSDIDHDAVAKWEAALPQWENDYEILVNERASNYYDKQAMLPYNPILYGFPKCEKHGVLLSIWGCQACTD